MITFRKLKLPLILLMFLSILLYSVISLYGKVSFLPAIIISILNILCIIWFLTRKTSKNIIIYIFFIYEIITLMLPMIIIFYVYSEEEIYRFLNYRSITPNDIFITNIYILFFTVLIMLFLFSFKKRINSEKWGISKIYWKNNSKFLYIFIFLLLSYLSKIYLMSTGVWFFYEMNDINISSNPYISYANLLEKLDLLVLLYFAFKYKIKKMSKVEWYIFIIILVISLLFAFPSTSKGKILTLLLPVFIMIFYTKNKLVPLISIMIFIPLLSIFFDTMLYLRSHPTDTISEALSSKSKISKGVGIIADNKVLNRINYQIVLSRVFKTYRPFPDKYRFDYVDNIIGVIPRVVWKDKPVIGMDMNKIGREIGLLQRSDYYTYVGITPLGVAYYELGIFGVLFIAIFTAILLAYFSKILQDKYWMGFILSLMVGIQLARNGTYTNIIPSIIQVMIVFFIFGLLLSKKYNDEKKLRFKW